MYFTKWPSSEGIPGELYFKQAGKLTSSIDVSAAVEGIVPVPGKPDGRSLVREVTGFTFGVKLGHGSVGTYKLSASVHLFGSNCIKHGLWDEPGYELCTTSFEYLSKFKRGGVCEENLDRTRNLFKTVIPVRSLISYSANYEALVFGDFRFWEIHYQTSPAKFFDLLLHDDLQERLLALVPMALIDHLVSVDYGCIVPSLEAVKLRLLGCVPGPLVGKLGLNGANVLAGLGLRLIAGSNIELDVGGGDTWFRLLMIGQVKQFKLISDPGVLLEGVPIDVEPVLSQTLSLKDDRRMLSTLIALVSDLGLGGALKFAGPECDWDLLIDVFGATELEGFFDAMPASTRSKIVLSDFNV